MMNKMIIANRLNDGRVVFAADDGNWVEAIDAGRQFGNDADTALTTLLNDPFVIDPNLIEVTTHSHHDGHHLRPTAIREAIRADGPTVDVEASASSATE